MVLMPSTDLSYNKKEQALLLSTAVQSIQSGFQRGKPLCLELSDYSSSMRQISATFVTLEMNEKLRGCMGRLTADRPLIEGVAENSFAAAFRDPRFPCLSKNEFPLLEIHISILSQPEPIQFESEEELLEKIRPNIDGLILSETIHQRGTFLPSVWESLPDKASFLKHLKQKAGLPENYWSNTIKAERYTTFSFGAGVRSIVKA